MNIITAKEITDNLYDRNFRQKLLSSATSTEALESLGYKYAEGVEVRIVKSTKDTTYVIMPDQSINLDQISAAGVTVGLGSAGSVSTISSTIGSASTAGSAILV